MGVLQMSNIDILREKFQSTNQAIIDQINADHSQYFLIAGEYLYEFVIGLSDDSHGPKITGMILH